MLETAIINCRQHVGLQKVSELARVTRSLIGPDKKYKFVQDAASGESVLVGSCFRVLENLELTCAAGQLVYETVRAHHKVHGTGSACLLFAAGAWSRTALACLQRGIPAQHIIASMSEGMEICTEVCKKSSLSLADLTRAPVGWSLQPITEAPRMSHELSPKPNIGHNLQTKLKLSRHFWDSKTEVPNPEHGTLGDISQIAAALSHGCDHSMKLVVDVIRMQSESQNLTHSMFDISRVGTCLLPGLPEESACVIKGCVIFLSDQRALTAHQIQNKRLKLALVTGDVSYSYRHLGFKRLSGLQRVCEQPSGSSREDEWLEKVSKLLLNLDVHLLLVRGHASEELVRLCCRHEILVVEKVDLSVLRLLASSTGAVPVSYATQLSEHCVGDGVELGVWRDLGSHVGKPSTAFSVCAGGRCEPATVVITGYVHGKLQALEDEFWACAHRLRHALKDGALLPGAGRTELVCADRLRARAEANGEDGHKAKPYEGAVLWLMADGLTDYVMTLMANSGRPRTAINQQPQNLKDQDFASEFSRLVLDGTASTRENSDEANGVGVCDNLSVKLEAWRKALDLVFLVLQTDAEIITGSGQEGAEGLKLL